MTRISARSRLNSYLRDIRRDYRHQVALPDDLCCMENYTTIAAFCKRHALDHLTTPVTAKWPNGKQEKYRLHCFRTPEAAKLFADHFSGTPFDPERDREGGKLTGAWLRTDEWKPVERCGPLEMPRFFRENP